MQNEKDYLISTKTSLAKFDVYFFKHFTGTIPGDVPHRSSQLSQALGYRQFLLIGCHMRMRPARLVSYAFLYTTINEIIRFLFIR